MFPIPKSALQNFSISLVLMLCRSFFQSVCVLGYCLFPLTIAALVNLFVHTFFVRVPVIAVTYAWSAIGMLRIDVSLMKFSFGVGVAWKSA